MSRDIDGASSDTAGFFTLEATIALAIGAAIIAVAFSALATQVERTAVAEYRLLAAKKAETMIRRIGLDLPASPGAYQGTEEGGWTWELQITPLRENDRPTRLLRAAFSSKRGSASSPLFAIETSISPDAAR
jgi:hypothetical protein